jgi:hypothetical protein
MADMLVVAALELSHPMLLIVLMKADNAALHGRPLVAERCPLSGAVRRSVPRSVGRFSPPCACSRPIPAAMSTIANARTSIRASLKSVRGLKKGPYVHIRSLDFKDLQAGL